MNRRSSSSIVANAKRAIVLMLVILLNASVVFGVDSAPALGTAGVEQAPTQASPVSSREVRLDAEYFKGYLLDTGHILTAPARWDRSDWLTAVGVTGIAAGLYANDENIKNWVQERRNTTTGDIVKNVKRVGRAILPGLGALYLYGWAADDGKAKSTVLLSIESFAITGVFVQTLKFSTHRHRPYTGDPHDTWDGASFSNDGGRLSFPSGDASSAFAVATVVASEYDNVVVPVLAYGAATAIALGRVHDNGHWSSDVFVGSAIGYFTGRTVVKSHSGAGDAGLSLVPVMDGKTTGLLANYRF